MRPMGLVLAGITCMRAGASSVRGCFAAWLAISMACWRSILGC
jgi:hypothetical protein